MLRLAQYERYGVPEYWIVDPVDRAVEIYRLEEGSYGPALVVRPPDAARPLCPEGLEIDVADLFGD